MTAPTFLSGLSDAELKMVERKIEQHVPPEILEARDGAAKALQEAEVGWQKAQDRIGEWAGLMKDANGLWVEPTEEAA